MQTLKRLLRQPAAPLLAIVTLALGLGISTALFTVTRDVVLRPFPFRDQERIVAIWSNVPELLAIIGVYAVLAYAVRNRTTEMGVRLALGARSGDLLRLVVRHAVVLSLIATICGAVAAFVLTRFLGSFLYGVSRAEPLTLALAAAIVIAAAIAGSVVPAWSAARTDPMVALRDE